MASSSFLAVGQRHSLSPLLTPGSRLVSDKHNGESMTKCTRIKTPQSVLHLLKQNIPYEHCDSVSAGLPLTPLCVSLRACCFSPHGGSWGLGSLGEWRGGSLLAFDAELREGQQTVIVFITAARVERSVTGLDRGWWRYLLLMGWVLVCTS